MRVLREAQEPMTFDELLKAVNAILPIQAKDFKVKLQNILSTKELVQRTKDGRYGYLPKLITGAILRMPLTKKGLSDHSLFLTIEVIEAIYPTWWEREAERNLLLPDGTEFTVQYERSGNQRIQGIENLWAWLSRQGAKHGDDLIAQVVSGGGKVYQLALERRKERDEQRIAERNKALADEAEEIVGRARDYVFLPNLVQRLLARGVYHDPCPPDPLEQVLISDGRFKIHGLDIALATKYDRMYETLFEGEGNS